MSSPTDQQVKAGRSRAPRVFKGHGTENDFVILDDLDAEVSISSDLVRALCDRRAGIGADGLLRVVRTELATEPDVRAQADTAEFFMDYHNADGTIAEMCGNGIRVFARYLRHVGLIAGDVLVATRGGPKQIHFDSDRISVTMGVPVVRSERRLVALGIETVVAEHAVEMPNPHVVVELPADAVQQLQELDLRSVPAVTPPLPDGQNVEFVTVTDDHELRMRVHERGVGETRSCGTGICAVVAVMAQDRKPWQVHVPGGHCTVTWDEHGALVLTGPATLVAEVVMHPDWLATYR